MDQLLTDNIWKQVALLVDTDALKVAAIAYVTNDAYLSFHQNDILVCDASDSAIKSGQTSAQTLKRLLDCGVQLFSCPGLHAKALVSGDLAVIGSSNLSASSATNLIEASLVTRRFQARSQVRAFIQKLIRISTPIDFEFIARALDLPVAVRLRGKVDLVGSIEQPTNKTWVVSTSPLSEQIKEREEEFENMCEKTARDRIADPEGSISWIRWVGRSKFRSTAKEGDTIIELERNKQKNRCRVIQPRPIVVRQDHDKWTRFYLDDAPATAGFSWRQFTAKLAESGIKGIRMNTTRELTPREVDLMELIWSDR